MALQEGKCCFVGEVYGDLGVDLSLQLHQLTDPVAREEGEVWETLVDRASDEGTQLKVNHKLRGEQQIFTLTKFEPDVHSVHDT